MGNKDSRECGGGGGFVGGGCIFLLGLQGFGVRGPTSLWGKKKRQIMEGPVMAGTRQSSIK